MGSPKSVNQKNSKKNGRFLKVYDWDDVITRICARYIEGEKINDILEDDDMPAKTNFWVKLKENPDYMAQWDVAGHGKAMYFDSQFDEINKDAQEAFRNNKLNANALKVRLETLKMHRCHLNPKYLDRGVTHTIEAGESLRELMTKARKRASLELPTIDGTFVET